MSTAQTATRLLRGRGQRVTPAACSTDLFRDAATQVLRASRPSSQGRWKAVVIGSYERGDRALTAQRLPELAAFYRVPITELLPQPRGAEAPKGAAGLVIALEQIERVPDEQREPLSRYARRIQTERGDYNGRVLSLRADDLRSLAVLYEASREEVKERLAEWGVLVPAA